MKHVGERARRAVDTDELHRSVPRRLGEFALKAGMSLRKHVGLGLASAGLAAPLAGAWGVTHATTKDMIGASQAEFATTLGTQIKLDLGPAGNVYLPSPVAPLSMDVTVKGIPIEDGKSLLSPALLDDYRETFDNLGPYLGHIRHNLITDAIWKGLAAEVVAGSALFAAARNRHKLKRAVKPAVVGLAAAGVVAAPFAVDHIDTQAPPEARYMIPQLDGTPLAGTEVNSLVLQDLFKTILPEWQRLQEREVADRKAYLALSNEQLLAAADWIGQRAPGEQVIAVYSDMHSSVVMPQVYRTLTDIAQPDIAINAGDQSNNATTAQNAAMKNQVDIMDEPDRNVFVLGNHDSDATGKAIKAAGGELLDGDTVTIDDLKILGYSDPVVNYANSTARYQRDSKGPQTEQELGQAAYEEAEKTEADILVVHQPTAAKAFMESAGIKPTTVKLLINGHMHAADGPHVVPNSDGTYMVTYQSGTSGGKKALSATSYWTPESKPGTDATVTLFFIDSATKEPVAYQMLTFMPEGIVNIGDKTYLDVPQPATIPGLAPGEQAGGEVAGQQER